MTHTTPNFPPTEPDVAELTSQLVQIPSVNPMGRALDPAICFEHRITDFLADWFNRHGLESERHTAMSATDSSPARENVLAILPGNKPISSICAARTNSPPDPTKTISRAGVLMLEVHQDTVPVDGMTIPPWSGDIQNGCVHGRGACDIKGGMAVILTVMARLQRLSPDERPTIVVACSVNEEHGFDGASHIRDLWRAGTSRILPQAPDALIVTEPTLLDVVVAHKGCIRWKATTHGTATHSSQPQKGKNAIYAMAPVLTALETFAQDIAPTLGEHPRLSRPTLSVGTVQGGVSVNTVPDHCEIQIDLRVLPGQDPLAVREETIRYVQSQLATKDEVTFSEPTIVAPAMPDDTNGALAESLAGTLRKRELPGNFLGVAYGTDASALATDDVPTVVFGPGSISQAHTKDEWVRVEQLQKATDVLYDFITQ